MAAFLDAFKKEVNAQHHTILFGLSELQNVVCLSDMRTQGY
jgi:hypothetical protein